MFRHRFDVRTMLSAFELNVKNLSFDQQKISQMQSVFYEELKINDETLGQQQLHLSALFIRTVKLRVIPNTSTKGHIITRL